MYKFATAFFGFYSWHMLGVTVGYHRLLSHRSFSCNNKLVEYFWVLPGYLAFEGAPMWWATIHRAHHRYVDTPLDPHSPRNGLLHAWWGWIAKRHYPAHVNPTLQSKDLNKDPVYRFLDQDGDLLRAAGLVVGFNILFRTLILARFGWTIAAASLLAGCTAMQVPVMLNVLCHLPRLGYRNFDTEDDSVNIWWVALLAMGEGWHNNHHAAPGSARSGIKPSELDVSWLVIRGMEKIGLVSRVNDPICNAPAQSRIEEEAEFEEEAELEDELFWQTHLIPSAL